MATKKKAIKDANIDNAENVIAAVESAEAVEAPQSEAQNEDNDKLTRNAFSQADEAFIEKNYASMSAKQIAEKLGRSLASVSMKINALRKDGRIERKRETLSQELYNKIVALRNEGKSKAEVMAEVGCKQPTYDKAISVYNFQNPDKPFSKGRKFREVDPAQQEKLRQMFRDGLTLTDVVKETGLSKAEVMRVTACKIGELRPTRATGKRTSNKINKQIVPILNRIQKQLADWQKLTFSLTEKDRQAFHMLLGASEEFGELIDAHMKSTSIEIGEEKTKSDVADAVIDVVIFLMQFCTAVGIQFAQVFEATLQSVLSRTFEQSPSANCVAPELIVNQLELLRDVNLSSQAMLKNDQGIKGDSEHHRQAYLKHLRAANESITSAMVSVANDE